jgi:signal transduction histidine kinase
MLHEFLTLYRDIIITRTREKVTNRPWPLASTSELEYGVPLFLTQLTDMLRAETADTATAQRAIAASATLHGGQLLTRGFNVSQVVHDYGDICQAVTELIVEHQAPITAHEFHIFNRCLDTAIAEAVTEHARVTAAARSAAEVERSGQLAHEIRDMLNTAMFAFEALKSGTVSINGSTGGVLGRSLVGLRDLVASTLSDIRMSTNHQRRERVAVTDFVQEIAAAARLHAAYRSVQFEVDPVLSDLAIDIDPQLLASAVMNLLNNAFKYTSAGGTVVLRAYREDQRLRIEVEDACGGMLAGGNPFEAFAERRGSDRSGLGLGLSIARKAVRAHGGDIRIRNMPGKGCVFTVDVPLAGHETHPPTPDVVTDQR